MSYIYTAYSEEADMTFIMEEANRILSVKGFYFGEPDDDSTKEYFGKKLEAIVEE